MTTPLQERFKQHHIDHAYHETMVDGRRTCYPDVDDFMVPWLKEQHYKRTRSVFSLTQLEAGNRRNRQPYSDSLEPWFDHTRYYIRNGGPALIITQPYTHVDFRQIHDGLKAMHLDLYDLGIKSTHNPGSCVLLAIAKRGVHPRGHNAVTDIDAYVAGQLERLSTDPMTRWVATIEDPGAFLKQQGRRQTVTDDHLAALIAEVIS